MYKYMYFIYFCHFFQYFDSLFPKFLNKMFSQSKNLSRVRKPETYISRVDRKTVIQLKHTVFLKPLFRGNFDPFINNANLGAIAHMSNGT